MKRLPHGEFVSLVQDRYYRQRSEGNLKPEIVKLIHQLIPDKVTT
ncbi:hypothetical protein [Bremerella volcania]|nr:hypothetical protein [Bremerella volcania]